MRTQRAILLLCLFFAAWIAWAAGDGPGQQQMRKLLEQGNAEDQESLATFAVRLAGAYDLYADSRAAFKATADDPEFKKFLRSKGVDPEKITKAEEDRLAEWIEEYLAQTGKLKPEHFAWIRLTHSTGLTWRESVADYRILEKARPNDFAPPFFMLNLRLANAQESADWFSTLKRAYALGTDEVQKASCLMISGQNILALGMTNFGSATITQLGEWLRSLTQDQPSHLVLKKASPLLFLVAFAQKDYEQAAKYGKDSPLRAFLPILLLTEHKNEQARALITELKQRPDLLDRERGVIEAAEKALKTMEKPETK